MYKGFISILGGFTVINFLKALVPFFLLPILTRSLSIDDYGVLSIFESTILILTPLLLFNAQGYLSAKYYLITQEEVANINTNVLGLALITSGLIFIVFSFVPKFIKELLGLSGDDFMLIPLFVMCRMLNTYIGVNWQIRHQLKAYGFFSLGTLFSDLLISLLLVVALKQGYIGRLAGSHIAMLFFSVIGIYFLRRQGLFRGYISRASILKIVRFGTPLIPHSLGGVSLAMASRYFLSNDLGIGAVGVFVVAYQMASVMLLIGTSINQAWSVSLFRLLAQGAEQNRETIQRMMISTLAMLVASYVMLFLLKDIIFWLFLSKKFDESIEYFSLFLLSFTFQSVYFLFVNFDFYEERVKSIGLTTLLTAVINIALNVLLIPRYGVFGAVYATVGSMGIYMLLVIVRVSVFNKSFRLVWGL